MRYGVAIIIIAFLAIVGTIVLLGRGGKTATGSNGPKTVKVSDYADKSSSQVSWTLQGRLVGEDQRRAIRITVSQSARRIEILDGYEETVERSEDFNNTPTAYETFIQALQVANFGKERVVKNTDERGICPLGNRTIYKLEDNGKEVVRTWSDTCLATDGPFAGGVSTTQQLFKLQITDYEKFITGVQL